MPGDYGLKVSAPGTDARNVSAKDALFNTNYSALKVYQWVNLQVVTNGSGNGSATVAHSLGYAPAFFVFRNGTAHWATLDASSYANSWFPVGGVNYWAGTDHEHIYAYGDDTNVGVSINGGTPSTTYNFRVYILVDNSKVFSSAGVYGLNKDWGFKVSKPGYSVLTAEEYNMVYSSKYKTLQYYDVNKVSDTLNLPIMFSSIVDTDVEEGTYVDWQHGLGYAPFFLAYFSSNVAPYGTDNEIFEVPFSIVLSNASAPAYSITGFSNSSFVRLSFWRASHYTGLFDTWQDETITLKLIVFTENLAGPTNP